MTKLQPILYTAGFLLIILAFLMLPCALIDYVDNALNWQSILIAITITGFAGSMLVLSFKINRQIHISIKQVFLLTTISWITTWIFSSLPFLLSPYNFSITNAFFETISGLTTTGATIIINIEQLSRGLILWRSMLQWLGGIGIIVMALTVMPLLRIGGMQLFRSEFSDRSEKVLPKFSQISFALVLTYFIMTLTCALLLKIAGMSWFDACCHSFTTVSTGGFSTHTNSIAYFNSIAIEIIISIFMILGSITLTLFIRFANGDRQALIKDRQVRGFIKIILFAMFVLLFYRLSHHADIEHAVRETYFNIISIVSTTGFTTSDYNSYGLFPSYFILILMMVGGCSGSTSGGIKVFRYQIMMGVIRMHLSQLRRPHAINIAKFNDKPITNDVMISVFTFFAIYCVCLVILSLALCFYEIDLASALSAAVSSLNNIGPGIGDIIGPTGHFALFQNEPKWLLMFGMLLGRLEYFTILILFMRRFWQD